MKAYNQRQYKLMLVKLRYFQKSKYKLDNFITDIYALYSVIKNADKEWIEKIEKLNSDLEQSNAYYKHSSYEELREEAKKKLDSGLADVEINSTVDELVKLVKAKILPNQEDEEGE